MIRSLIMLILFIIYGNINSAINDIVILSFISIGLYTILKEKNLKNFDIFIFIMCTFITENFIGLPLFIGIVILFIPLIIINNFINNYNFSLILKSLIIFLLSFIVFFIFDQTIILRILNFQYLITLFILLTIYLGFFKYGKK